MVVAVLRILVRFKASSVQTMHASEKGGHMVDTRREATRSAWCLSVEEARFYETVGARVRAARLRRGISVAELADAIQVVVSTINNLERGNHAVALHIYLRIARVLGIQVGRLVSGTTTQE